MMTNVSAWLLGLLSIASVLMCVLLFPVVAGEWKAGDWRRNKAFWLAAALWVHPIGAIIMFVATMASGVRYEEGLILYGLWTAWGLWLAAKTMVIHVNGRLQLALALYALWSILLIAWR
ncbi:hypothetical protein [Novosphingobium sp. M1R2S20]|uniref:Uncharacterized protein n=1 Tax=Novosphingobium rhizovicinum TaxID=3228928 RepID=A0ABV3RD94_9SPHN